MKEIETEELKRIQLDILLALNAFCMEHQIKYSLAAGSLIGAIRHKGYIPWDDDIDVYLLREDYNKLISVFPSLYEGRYKLVSLERCEQWYRPYGKLYNCQTIMREESRNEFLDMGVNIDLFPIDDAPDNQMEWKSYNRRRIFLRRLFVVKSLLYSKRRGIAKNMIIFICRLALCPFSFKFLSDLLNRYAQKNNDKGYMHVYENCLGVYNSKHPWHKSSFNVTLDAEFEGHQIKIMDGYNDYLSCVYGDYMQLPPEENRISHHYFNAYWK